MGCSTIRGGCEPVCKREREGAMMRLKSFLYKLQGTMMQVGDGQGDRGNLPFPLRQSLSVAVSCRESSAVWQMLKEISGK